MSTTRNNLLLLVVALVLPACASQGPYESVYPQAVFAHRVSSPDVDIYWNCTQPEAGLVRFGGVAQNTGGAYVRFLKLQVAGVDAKDRNIVEAAAAVPDISLYTNQKSPFQMDLRTAGGEVRFDLFYQYSIGSLSRELHFMARDVCSETQHRVTNMGG